MCYLKSIGASHNDLKLENIVIRDDLTLALIDFGDLSAFGGVRSGHVGTPQFQAPEVYASMLNNGRSAYHSDKIDVFTVGACLMTLEFLTYPFEEGARSSDTHYRYIWFRTHDSYRSFFASH